MWLVNEFWIMMELFGLILEISMSMLSIFRLVVIVVLWLCVRVCMVMRIVV